MPNYIALLLVVGALACAPSGPEPAPEPRTQPGDRPPAADAPRRAPSSLEAMLAEDMAPEQAMPWSALRPLRWSDFKAEPPRGGPEGARTGTGLYYAWFCRGETFGFRATAALHPHRSWVKPLVVNDARESARVLRHEQTHFDIAEVSARRMRQRFAALSGACAKPDSELKALGRQLLDEEKAMQQRYDRETNHGLVAGRQSAWNTDVARMLAASSRYAQ